MNHLQVKNARDAKGGVDAVIELLKALPDQAALEPSISLLNATSLSLGGLADSDPVDDTIYYGPHPCEACGGKIVRVSKEQGGAAFDIPHPTYPNSEWPSHVCNPPAPAA